MADDQENPPTPLSEIEIAIVDAFKSLADVLMAMNPNAAKALTNSFEHQRNGKIRTGQPNAALVFEMLRAFVADPERQAIRERIRQLLSAPPQGRA
jgi:hypothetical protein